jgi:hypothetical protein
VKNHQPGGIRIWEIPEQGGIEEREDDGIRRYPERQNRNGYEKEPSGLPQRAERIAHILEKSSYQSFPPSQSLEFRYHAKQAVEQAGCRRKWGFPRTGKKTTGNLLSAC